MALRGIFLFIPDSRIRSQPFHLIGVGEQPLDSIGERRRIAGRNLDPALAVTQRFPQTTPIGIENGQSGGHGFQHHERLPLLLDSGKDEQIGRMQQRRFLRARDLAGPCDRRADPLLRNIGLGFLPMLLMGPGAGKDALHIGPRLNDQRDRFQQHQGSLHLIERIQIEHLPSAAQPG